MKSLRAFNFDQMVSEKGDGVDDTLKDAVLLNAISKEIKKQSQNL
ncbi:hypothetical protein [Entomomonas moraniae]|nr:hypothetical protein [Entomomonas moraniae]